MILRSNVLRFLTIALLLCGYIFSIAAKKKHNLVDVKRLIPDIVLDIRYATADNFTQQQIYTSPECYLLHDVAQALAAVQQELRTIGLGLKIWDGYRPLSAQWALWKVVPDERYVANPRNGGRHCRGTTVDVTLIELATGKELPMPTEFDNFTEKAWRSCMDLPEEVLRNRELLQNVMERYGFEGLPTEWWHFDFKGWKERESLDIHFEEL